MADLDINNQRQFYEEVSVKDNAALRIELTNQTGVEIKPLNQRRFFQLIRLNNNGALKVFK